MGNLLSRLGGSGAGRTCLVRKLLPPVISWIMAAVSYLTNNMTTLDRFPISFKTHFSGNYFRHIVLGVNFGGRYGALGISRREELMYKAPVFRTLSELIFDFEEAYRRCWHTLKKVKLGHCVSHDPHSVEQIEWKRSILDLDKLTREDFRKELERHARDMRLKVSSEDGVAHCYIHCLAWLLGVLGECSDRKFSTSRCVEWKVNWRLGPLSYWIPPTLYRLVP